MAVAQRGAPPYRALEDIPANLKDPAQGGSGGRGCARPKTVLSVERRVDPVLRASLDRARLAHVRELQRIKARPAAVCQLQLRPSPQDLGTRRAKRDELSQAHVQERQRADAATASRIEVDNQRRQRRRDQEQRLLMGRLNISGQGARRLRKEQESAAVAFEQLRLRCERTGPRLASDDDLWALRGAHFRSVAEQSP